VLPPARVVLAGALSDRVFTSVNNLPSSMRFLAVDPGTDQSAVLFWKGGHVSLPRIMPNSELRQWLLENDWAADGGTVMAVEFIQAMGMAVGREVFETCVFVGRLQEIWESRSRPFRRIYRRDVKLHLCGTMKAKDANIRQALIDRYGIPGTKKSPGPLFGVSSHLWSALAVAVTAEHQILTEQKL